MVERKVRMVQKDSHKAKNDSVTIRMDITVDLPAEMADEVERLGLYQFEQCRYDEGRRRLTVSATTTFYKNGGAFYEKKAV